MAEHVRRAKVSLCDLLNDARVVGPRPEPVSGCACDWQKLQPREAYVALDNGSCDGHEHAHEAIERGASALVCERLLPFAHVPQLIVPDSRRAYAQLCHALAGRPSGQLQVAGITATSGKTCVASLFESILLEANRPAGSISSLGFNDSCEKLYQDGTDSDPSTLAFWLSRMVASGASHAIVELSSAALAGSRVEGIELDALCIHNLDGDHLDVHGSLENYRRAKWQILDHLRPHALAVLNADDPHCCRMLSELEQPALTFGIHRPAELMAVVVEEFVGEQTFLLEAGGDAVAVRSPIIGEHHRYNCLAAATLALGYGIDLATIARGLEQARRIPGRIDRVEFGQPFGLWLDAADSPHQLRAMLSAVRNVAHGRVICVVVPRPGDCQSTRRKMQQVVRRLSEQSVIVDVHRQEQQQLIADFSAATSWALRQAAAGDAVVIAASPRAKVINHVACEQAGGLTEWLQLASCQ